MDTTATEKFALADGPTPAAPIAADISSTHVIFTFKQPLLQQLSEVMPPCRPNPR